jgi:hypothetical protein
MMRSRPAFSLIVVAALVLGACSSGDSSNGDRRCQFQPPHVTTRRSADSRCLPVRLDDVDRRRAHDDDDVRQRH